VYRHGTPEDLYQLAPLDPVETQASLTWVYVYRHGPIGSDDLAQELKLDAEEAEAALERLLADGRIRAEERDSGVLYRTDQCLIPLGSQAGWEAAIVDHYRALVSALIAKLAAGARSASAADEIGGSTFTFHIWPGHPCEERTRCLLSSMRTELSELWDEVNRQPDRNGQSDDRSYRVTFYCGQYLEMDEQEEES
jgi:hypothetical protein